MVSVIFESPGLIVLAEDVTDVTFGGDVNPNVPVPVTAPLALVTRNVLSEVGASLDRPLEFFSTINRGPLPATFAAMVTLTVTLVELVFVITAVTAPST